MLPIERPWTVLFVLHHACGQCRAVQESCQCKIYIFVIPELIKPNHLSLSIYHFWLKEKAQTRAHTPTRTQTHT